MTRFPIFNIINKLFRQALKYKTYYKDRDLSGLRLFMKVDEGFSNRFTKRITIINYKHAIYKGLKQIFENIYMRIRWIDLLTILKHNIDPIKKKDLHEFYELLHEILEFTYEINPYLESHLVREFERLAIKIDESNYELIDSILVLLNKLSNSLKYEWIRLICTAPSFVVTSLIDFFINTNKKAQ